MKVRLLYFLALFGLFGLPACTKENPTPEGPAGPGNYSKGVFVINEGPFGGTGSISWLNPETGESEQDIFSKANSGAVLGQFVQSLTLHNGRGYIIVNGANKVYVVDAITFKFIDTIGGLALPRFMLPLSNDLALISQWGADGLTGSVAKVDLRTLKVVATIPTGKGPEKMIRQANGLVAVPNSGGFGVDSTVSILNVDNTAELQRITVPGKNPGTLTLANLNNSPAGLQTFVHCQGSFLDNDPMGWVGALDNTAGVSYTIPPYGNDLSSAPDRTQVYFVANEKVYRLTSSKLEAWLNQPAYGLGCDPVSGNLYCADAKDFSSSGEVVVYNPAGQQVGTFTVGVAPSEFVFIP